MRIVGRIRSVEMASPLVSMHCFVFSLSCYTCDKVQDLVDVVDERASSPESVSSRQEKGPRRQFRPESKSSVRSPVPREAERRAEFKVKSKQNEPFPVPRDRELKDKGNPRTNFSPRDVQKRDGRLEASQRNRDEKFQRQTAPQRTTRLQHQDSNDSMDIQEILRAMTARVTVWAQPKVFKCLIGAKGANIKKIKSECEAKITVEGQTLSFATRNTLCSSRSQGC